MSNACSSKVEVIMSKACSSKVVCFGLKGVRRHFSGNNQLGHRNYQNLRLCLLVFGVTFCP